MVLTPKLSRPPSAAARFHADQLAWFEAARIGITRMNAQHRLGRMVEQAPEGSRAHHAMPLIAQASGEQAEGRVRISGFAAGLTAHGIGTARAYQVSNEAGVYAALALAFAALLQGIVLPLVL